MKSILILLHCESNTGYAIAPLESTFFKMALAACNNDSSRIHFAYPSMQKGPTKTLPEDFAQYVVIDAKTTNPEEFVRAQAYIERHGIDTIFGFDQPVSRPIYKYFRRGGVRHFISYWGAPMSSVFGPVKLALKRLEVAMRRNAPDHYVFESQGMADTAVFGRGVPVRKVSVVNLGVDTSRFRLDETCQGYVHEKLMLNGSRRVFVYSGHMEERKGVAVIMRAANRLASERQADDWQMVLLGNKGDEEKPYWSMLTPAARDRVLFAGYRGDLEKLLPGCYAGIIASTGWDSFPRSAMEMQASGLPLIVSSLPGLRESIEHQRTGLLFPPGDDSALSAHIAALLDDTAMRDSMSSNARKRIEDAFSLECQFERLVNVLTRIAG